MDPFVAVGGMELTLLLALVLIGRFYPGEGADILDRTVRRTLRPRGR